jgi:hypothetical protein
MVFGISRLNTYYDWSLWAKRKADIPVENKISVKIKAIIKLETVQITEAINYSAAHNPGIGLLLYFGSWRSAFHQVTNKKNNHKIVQNPKTPIHPETSVQTYEKDTSIFI